MFAGLAVSERNARKHEAEHDYNLFHGDDHRVPPLELGPDAMIGLRGGIGYTAQ